eukprot:3405343-Prymnesium_polylepis.1
MAASALACLDCPRAHPARRGGRDKSDALGIVGDVRRARDRRFSPFRAVLKYDFIMIRIIRKRP